ncbi:MAG: ParB-like protein partition protein [Candidatus Gottesmanbacteria bacterium GW2011_GWB1_44_11c]|uniref:ParB-like protein partition protein n=2 Tax=Candidatus Gottesmaniibacteriota TaxID=1752720 RepID=A0A0G1KX54_9BACT|nr:MAG: ParB-like protein partition protein [Candidatus Gottesmanbacteria bacterium GW2011_GWB1_44_11c]KKT60907.1 MAG: ParB-like protein partition protein [Candidatus Gottesmanbacteria bacterium GW2011_GWA1_44_24b]
MHLDIDLVEPNPLQPRGLISPESLAELASSIREHGIIEPLVVAKTPAGYQIIAGERRWRAAKQAGLTTVPVIIRETTAKGMLEMALVENVQREDLNPIERAQAFQRLVEEFGLYVGEIAKRIGKSESYVSNTMRLLGLPDAIKDGLISGAISEGHARAIAGLGDIRLMVEAYKTILSENASVRRAEDLARRLKSQNDRQPMHRVERIHSDELDTMAKDIAQSVNGLVKITQSKVEARVVMVIRGNLETTSSILKKFREKLIK